LNGKTAVVTGAVGILGQRFCRGLAEFGAQVAVVDLDSDRCTAFAQELERDALGLRRDHAGADAPFRVDLGILFAGLIQRRRLEILDRRLVGLGRAELARQNGSERKK